MVEKLEESKICSEQSLVLNSLYLSPLGEGWGEVVFNYINAVFTTTKNRINC
ncbi:hypothetical protein BXY64_1591 [Marinifilum flexuosum]|uniref:Uncharacterized protein n=1 Tax=Marinifilum flexuosum TaxID=1117708 RepID=A0A419XA25_9BACT|nr:hypothetical protein BXY64_1591 [Marinifilum flexuosum]